MHSDYFSPFGMIIIIIIVAIIWGIADKRARN